MSISQEQYEYLVQCMNDKGVRHDAFELLADLRDNESKLAEENERFRQSAKVDESLFYIKPPIETGTLYSHLMFKDPDGELDDLKLSEHLSQREAEAQMRFRIEECRSNDAIVENINLLRELVDIKEVLSNDELCHEGMVFAIAKIIKHEGYKYE